MSLRAKALNLDDLTESVKQAKQVVDNALPPRSAGQELATMRGIAFKLILQEVLENEVA